jgi:hypothetical protein
MKRTIQIGLFFLVLLSLINCGNDDDAGCNGVLIDGECIPNYVFPQENKSIEYAKYYHSRHGVIIYDKGSWINSDGNMINEDELLIK